MSSPPEQAEGAQGSLPEHRAASLEPLLHCENLRLTGFEQPLDVTVVAPRLFCAEDAARLLPAMIDGSLIQSGRLTLLGGASSQDLLSRGLVGYCPRTLPAAPTMSVKDLLIKSARLIGLGKEPVEEALERCDIRSRQKRKVAELSRVELRLLSLAHGLTSNPRLVIVEDLLSDLDDAGAERVADILERELATRRWIVSGNTACHQLRKWFRTAGSVLFGTNGRIRGPLSPSLIETSSHWVVMQQSAEPLVSHLETLGIQYARSPNPHALLVEANSSLILRAAKECDATIVELSPAEANPIHTASGQTSREDSSQK